MTEPECLVSCPNDKVGDESDMRWLMMVAVVHRLRANRVAAARRVIRSRSGLISARQRQLMHGIIDGRDDLIKAKLEAFGHEVP